MRLITLKRSGPQPLAVTNRRRWLAFVGYTLPELDIQRILIACNQQRNLLIWLLLSFLVSSSCSSPSSSSLKLVALHALSLS